MQLTQNFWLAEFVKSPYAERLGIDNTPPPEVTAKLKALCEKVLQPLRDHFGKTVTITSGYRCPELNNEIGGSPSSQHMKGEAADLEIFGSSTYDVAKWLSENTEFDQIILEYYVPDDLNSGWTHVSYSMIGNRKQVLTKLKGEPGYRNGFVLV